MANVKNAGLHRTDLTFEDGDDARKADNAGMNNKDEIPLRIHAVFCQNSTALDIKLCGQPG